jgi:hypothetical protein
MEALAAISLVASVIQFVDFGRRAFASAIEVRNSADGMTKDIKDLDTITREMRNLSAQLASPSTGPINADERALRSLAQESYEVSERILRLVQETIPKNAKSKREVLLSTWKSLQCKTERETLERKLASCRDRLHLQYTRVTR